MNYSEMKLTELVKLPGISNIEPTIARAKFAQALKAEAKGEKEKAQQFLDDATKASHS